MLIIELQNFAGVEKKNLHYTEKEYSEWMPLQNEGRFETTFSCVSQSVYQENRLYLKSVISTIETNQSVRPFSVDRFIHELM